MGQEPDYNKPSIQFVLKINLDLFCHVFVHLYAWVLPQVLDGGHVRRLEGRHRLVVDRAHQLPLLLDTQTVRLQP